MHLPFFFFTLIFYVSLFHDDFFSKPFFQIHDLIRDLVHDAIWFDPDFVDADINKYDCIQ